MAGRRRLGLAEHAGMPADELLVDAARDLVEVALVLLLEEPREEEHLEEEVSQLVAQLRGIVGERGLRDLVRLLDGVRDDRARGLLAVPGALHPQDRGDVSELAE